jgi:hypothetical protein
MSRLKRPATEGSVASGHANTITWYRYAYDAFASHGITTPNSVPVRGKPQSSSKIHLCGLVTAGVVKFYGDRKIVGAPLGGVGELNEKFDPRKFGRRA